MTEPQPYCLNCEQVRDDCEHQLEKLRMEIHGWEQQYQAVVADYEIADVERRRALRRLKALERELSDSPGKENQEIRELCAYHTKLWKERFPKSPGLSYEMKDPSALAFRRALKTRLTLHGEDEPHRLTVEDVKAIMDVVFTSEFYRSKRTYMTPASFLRDADRIANHMRTVEARRQRVRDVERLREQGFKDPEKLVDGMSRCGDCGQVACVCAPVAVRAAPSEWRRCPACGSPGECWSGCPAKAVAS